jgi:hypothetical protein
MAVTYNAALKSARMREVIDAIDDDTDPGELIITDGTNALVSITLAKPSFTESGGVITMAGAPRSGDATATGTASVARIEDGGGTTVVSGLTVGTTGAEVNLNSVAISSGQTVTLNSGAITHG